MDYDSNAVKQKCLEILLEVDRICKENEIQYFIYSGTLLGAVRHDGFIPWDDDIDLVMFRTEYEKFIKICQTKLDSDRFELQTIYTDPYASNPWIKVHNKNTAFVSGVRRDGAMEGINIDIFPIDNAPDSDFVRKWRGRIINKLHFIYQYRFQYHSKQASLKMRVFQTIISFIPPWDEMKYKELHEKYIQKYNRKQTKHVVYMSNRNYATKVTDRANLKDTIEMSFEGHVFPAPAGWREILAGLYGKNYMEYPPVEQRVSQHGCTVFDTEHSWREYCGK